MNTNISNNDIFLQQKDLTEVSAMERKDKNREIDYNFSEKRYNADDVNIDASLFTGASHTISFDRKLAEIHNVLLNSEYLPEFTDINTDTDYNYGNYKKKDPFNSYINNLFGGSLDTESEDINKFAVSSTSSFNSESYDIPNNYYDTSTDIPSYRYSTSECAFTPKKVSTQSISSYRE